MPQRSHSRPTGALRRHAAVIDPENGGMTLEQVGAQLGLTRERVRQIEAEALRKVLAVVKARGLRREDLFD